MPSSRSQHEEVGFNNTIAEVAGLVRGLDLPGLRMMIDTFHMNIEEKDMLAPLPAIREILAHVHLSETNRDVPRRGSLGHGGVAADVREIGYAGHCSMGVYNTRLPRRVHGPVIRRRSSGEPVKRYEETR